MSIRLQQQNDGRDRHMPIPIYFFYTLFLSYREEITMTPALELMLKAYLSVPIVALIVVTGLLIMFRKGWTGTVDLFIVYWIFIAAICGLLVSFDFINDLLKATDHKVLRLIFGSVYLGEVLVCALAIVNFLDRITETLNKIKKFFDSCSEAATGIPRHWITYKNNKEKEERELERFKHLCGH